MPNNDRPFVNPHGTKLGVASSASAIPLTTVSMRAETPQAQQHERTEASSMVHRLCN